MLACADRIGPLWFYKEVAPITLADSTTTVTDFTMPVALRYRIGSFCSAHYRRANHVGIERYASQATFHFGYARYSGAPRWFRNICREACALSHAAGLESDRVLPGRSWPD